MYSSNTMLGCHVCTSRSLNHYLCRVDYHFMHEEEDEDEVTKQSRNKKYEQEFDDDSYKIVQNVVQETGQDLDRYLDKVNAKGHRWHEHYNSTWTESNLVCFAS